ncbi:UNVERIFIED_CONTAM: hypothetical protein FKN15_030348 [Acipenser sinensis]
MATSVVFDEDAIVTFLRAKVKATHLILAKEEELVKQDEILDKACQAIDEKYSRYPEYRAYGDAWKKLGKAEKELCYVADVRHLSEDERFTDVDVNGPVSVKRIVGYLTDHKNIIRKQLEASTVASNQHLDEEKEEEEEMHRALTISRSWADDDIETDAVVFQDQKGPAKFTDGQTGCPAVDTFPAQFLPATLQDGQTHPRHVVFDTVANLTSNKGRTLRVAFDKLIGGTEAAQTHRLPATSQCYGIFVREGRETTQKASVVFVLWPFDRACSTVFMARCVVTV